MTPDKVKKIAIVSLSAGTIGEDFVKHELDIGIRRLQEYGLDVIFMPHALKGIRYVKEHPEKRAEDLLNAFRDPSIDMILCAIGGDDTYRLLPYLFEENALSSVISDKIFLGFSDTTLNHFMLRKCGLNTFYGQSFLADICELEPNILPYTASYFEELLHTGTIREIRPSNIWYEAREHFGIDQINVPLIQHPDSGFELLQGSPVFKGEILGGCIDSMLDMFDPTSYADMPELCRKYQIFPDQEEWKGKILLLETSEVLMKPETYRKALSILKEQGVFNAVNGVLCGKPMNRFYYEEYKEILKEVIDDRSLPVVCNLNIGHAQPRCIIPFGVKAVVNTEEQVIRFEAGKEEAL